MWVHLLNQTPMQHGSRCNLTCIDIQYTPLHANITYLICFMCFWCFGRRSAALMVHGYITCPEQTKYSKKTAYYFWSLGRCETWCKHVQTALIVCSITAHNRRPLKKGIFRFFHLFQTYPLIFHGVPMRTWPISELQTHKFALSFAGLNTSFKDAQVWLFQHVFTAFHVGQFIRSSKRPSLSTRLVHNMSKSHERSVQQRTLQNSRTTRNIPNTWCLCAVIHTACIYIANCIWDQPLRCVCLFRILPAWSLVTFST